MNGILGAWDLYANINQAIFTNSYSGVNVVVVNFCNKSQSEVTVRIAVSTSTTAPTDAEWIVYDAVVGPRSAFEKTSILVSPGQSIVVRSNSSNVNAICFGVTNGTTAPATNTRNIGTAPTWVTASPLTTVYAGDSLTSIQLSATDAEGESVTYALSSGSLPTGLNLSSSGLITGTPSVVGYALGAPDASSTVSISATDSRGNATPKSFNVIKRWADGSSQALAATSAQVIYNLSTTYQGSAASNWYWIKGNTTDTSQARKMYCSMNGGGYMLWYHYRDPMSGSLSISDPGNAGTTYTLTSTTAMFMYAVPTAIVNTATYLYLNSDSDTSYQTPAFANFKYAVAMDSELRSWVSAEKAAGSYWGIRSTPVNQIRLVVPTVGGLPNYRYGTDIGEMQYGHNNGGSDEVDGLAFRNSYGTGGYKWSTASHIWDYAGWGAIDASSPTNVNTGWGTTGSDEGTWSGTNRQAHLYAWIR